MTDSTTRRSADTFRNLPSVDALIRTPTGARLREELGSERLTLRARLVIGELREALIRNGPDGTLDASAPALLMEAETRLGQAWEAENVRRLQRVINATGVIIHTNLGRAPLSAAARRAIADTAADYCTLEYDIETGQRGPRGGEAEAILAELTGAESAIVVNNCAAAAFLVLTAFAKGGEVAVSRGELVEIGGDFRVPDVLAQSGAVLREVGTTNRTRASDYEKALGENTRMILRVHPSNYKIVGFTSAPGLDELAAIAHKRGLLLYEDAGSGALVDLGPFGLNDEPVIADSIAAGADLVTFSGDKLLGGPQAGIIVGRRELIDTIRKHPLYRALRVSKLVYAALSATLASYRREKAAEEVPVLRMLSMTREQLGQRAQSFIKRLDGSADGLRLEAVEGNSAVGGGSAPAVHPESILIMLRHAKLSADAIETALRRHTTPVIARILDDAVLIDLRTVAESEEEELLNAIRSVAA